MSAPPILTTRTWNTRTCSRLISGRRSFRGRICETRNSSPQSSLTRTCASRSSRRATGGNRSQRHGLDRREYRRYRFARRARPDASAGLLGQIAQRRNSGGHTRRAGASGVRRPAVGGACGSQRSHRRKIPSINSFVHNCANTTTARPFPRAYRSERRRLGRSPESVPTCKSSDRRRARR